MTGISFSCAKCDHDRYETGELHGAGGFWSKIFDVQGARFSTPLIPIVVGLVRPLHRHADIVGLLLCELGELHTQVIEV